MKNNIIQQIRNRSHYLNASKPLLKYRLNGKLKDLKRVLKKAESTHEGCFAFCADPSYYPHLIPPDLNVKFIWLIKNEIKKVEQKIQEL